MTNERLEELASLHALNLLDAADEAELLEEVRRNPEVARILRAYLETSAELALTAPGVVPPPRLKEAIMSRLPVPGKPEPRLVRFPQWIPYAIAAALMTVAIVQAIHIADLHARLRNLQGGLIARDGEVEELRQTNALKDLRLAELQAAAGARTNPALAVSHILVAWDPLQRHGVISLRDLPAPPPGRDYQLWVLDPGTPAPISAGLLTMSHAFAVDTVKSAKPGFAISLEPSGGSPTPTGPVLFAVAAGQ